MYLYGASGHAKVIIDILEASGIQGIFRPYPDGRGFHAFQTGTGLLSAGCQCVRASRVALCRVRGLLQRAEGRTGGRNEGGGAFHHERAGADSGLVRCRDSGFSGLRRGKSEGFARVNGL